MSHKMIRGRNRRVFRYFVVLCNSCGKYEKSLGDVNVNVHCLECVSASFSMTKLPLVCFKCWFISCCMYIYCSAECLHHLLRNMQLLSLSQIGQKLCQLNGLMLMRIRQVSATSRHVLSKVQFKSLCGCCSPVYTNWRALKIHLNEASSHKRLPAPSFSMTTCSFQTVTASTPLPTTVSSPSSQFLILPPSLLPSHPNLQPSFITVLLTL